MNANSKKSINAICTPQTWILCQPFEKLSKKLKEHSETLKLLFCSKALPALCPCRVSTGPVLDKAEKTSVSLPAIH